jgi:hypothetical protein
MPGVPDGLHPIAPGAIGPEIHASYFELAPAGAGVLSLN